MAAQLPGALKRWNAGGSLPQALLPPSPLPWVEMGAAKRYRLPAPTPFTGARDSLAPVERSHGNRVMAQVAMPAEEQRGRPAPRPPPGWIGDRQGLNLPR